MSGSLKVVNLDPVERFNAVTWSYLTDNFFSKTLKALLMIWQRIMKMHFCSSNVAEIIPLFE